METQTDSDLEEMVHEASKLQVETANQFMNILG